MNALVLGASLFTLTATTVVVYPSIQQTQTVPDYPIIATAAAHTSAPVIDVVFVLDTTASMSGLIQTAKDKIWSIATTMTSARQTPHIRIGLVGFRDRGDDYVTRIVDLSDDLDSVYAALMDFQASGGGDGPESVNKALYDAVHGMSWSQNIDAYQTIFLVGDAPPHMDYGDEEVYPEVLAAARKKGITVNAIQCGDDVSATKPWKDIATLGAGRFFQVAHSGNAVAIATPYDQKIADLSAKLDSTRLYYGSVDEKARMQSKVDATEKLTQGASLASLARRGAFNASKGGKKNLLGENELVEAISSGRVDLVDIEQDALPATIKSLEPAEQLAVIKQKKEARASLESQINDLAKQRSVYISNEVEATEDVQSSLDHQLYDAVREQAADAGLDYRDGPEY